MGVEDAKKADESPSMASPPLSPGVHGCPPSGDAIGAIQGDALAGAHKGSISAVKSDSLGSSNAAVILSGGHVSCQCAWPTAASASVLCCATIDFLGLTHQAYQVPLQILSVNDRTASE